MIGGPFTEKYVFAQIHFHWGETAMNGSEHSVDGEKLPLEMHAVFFNSSYGNQTEALQFDDGIAVLVYFFQIKWDDSEILKIILCDSPAVLEANSSRLIEPFLLTDLLHPFDGDYYLLMACN